MGLDKQCGWGWSDRVRGVGGDGVIGFVVWVGME